MLGLVWAQSANGVVGRDNAIPWRIPEDMAHFRALTAGATVLMGRRTWESLPAHFRPLPGRRNMVLTRTAGWTADGAEVAASLDDALRHDGDIWVLGGASVWSEALPRADRVVRTEVRAAFEGDTLAPPLGAEWDSADPLDWQVSSSGLEYRIRTFARS